MSACVTSRTHPGAFSVPDVLDHIGINVSDYDRGRDFYAKALAPLGIELLMEPIPETGGLGREGKPFHWITGERKPATENVHAAAIEAGGVDNGAPGIRELYHPTYYGAYMLDPDGNNVEAVCHAPG